MTYGHLWVDCLYTRISSGPNARYRIWEAFTFFTWLILAHPVARVMYLLIFRHESLLDEEKMHSSERCWHPATPTGLMVQLTWPTLTWKATGGLLRLFKCIVKCWQYDINNDGMLDLLICTTEGHLVFVDAFGKLINFHQVSYWYHWSKLINVSSSHIHVYAATRVQPMYTSDIENRRHRSLLEHRWIGVGKSPMSM